VDWNSYPAHAVGKESMNAWRAPNSPAAALPTFSRALTTPVAYITSFPRDPYATGEASYLYWTGPVGKDAKGNPLPTNSYIIVSAGPDGDYDIADEWEAFSPADPVAAPRLAGGANKKGQAFSYDPTNGIVSGGDLWRAGGVSQLAQWNR
jgi:hypothetical protein